MIWVFENPHSYLNLEYKTKIISSGLICPCRYGLEGGTCHLFPYGILLYPRKTNLI